MKTTATSAPLRQVHFKVITSTPLPTGEQVFVTGADEALGHWDPNGLALTRMEDTVWEGEAMVAANATLEYKITRGSWASEEVQPDGLIPENHRLKPDQTATEDLVQQWHDRRIPQPHIVGDYRIHPQVESKHLDQSRTVIVWLPPSYKEDQSERFPVLYMHDGQQIFDPSTSTWNQDWEVDEWCSKLIYQNRLQEIIVVGIYSTTDRYAEYNPAERGEAYTQFVVEELKPFIDAEYATLPDRAHTAVAGSSMGGAISFYMAWTRPDVFFGAACLSSAFLHRQGKFTTQLVEKTETLPDLKLYLYCGAADDLEQKLRGDLYSMQRTLAAKGLTEGAKLRIVEDADGLHNEATWARHTDDWLLYLFGRES
jgi:predicted alpha/beta superfamily hydrolase